MASRAAKRSQMRERRRRHRLVYLDFKEAIDGSDPAIKARNGPFEMYEITAGTTMADADLSAIHYTMGALGGYNLERRFPAVRDANKFSDHGATAGASALIQFGRRIFSSRPIRGQLRERNAPKVSTTGASRSGEHDHSRSTSDRIKGTAPSCVHRQLGRICGITSAWRARWGLKEALQKIRARRAVLEVWSGEKNT